MSAPCSQPHLTLINISQKPCLQLALHGGLGLQHMTHGGGLGGRQGRGTNMHCITHNSSGEMDL